MLKDGESPTFNFRPIRWNPEASEETGSIPVSDPTAGLPPFVAHPAFWDVFSGRWVHNLTQETGNSLVPAFQRTTFSEERDDACFAMFEYKVRFGCEAL
jgi:hypothetical protein